MDASPSTDQNLNLGSYEMAVSLSMSAINNELKILSKMKDPKNPTQKIIRTKFVYWQIEDDDSGVLTRVTDGTKEEYNKAFADFEPEEEDPDKPQRILGFEGSTKVPTIEVKARTDKTVNMIFEFIDGEFNSKRTSIRHVSLEGLKLVFNVDIASAPTLKAEDEYNTPEAKKAVEDHINKIKSDFKQAHQPLSDKDFTVESLFLDLENVNFINDVKIYPVTADQEKYQQTIQTMLSSYLSDIFKHAKKNPYVLGYMVTLPALKPTEEALLQPRAMTYSVSYASDKDNNEDLARSCINFMMNTTPDAPAPRDTSMGTLITQNDAKKKYNVLGIDAALFNNEVITPIIQQIIQTLNASFAKISKNPQSTTSTFFAGPTRSSSQSLSVVSQTDWSYESSPICTLISTGKTLSPRQLQAFSDGSTTSPRGTSSSGSSMTVDMYYAPKITLDFFSSDENRGLDIILYCQVMNKYKHKNWNSAFYSSTDTGQSANYNYDNRLPHSDTECQKLRFRLAPDKMGSFSISSEILGENKYVTIKNEHKVVQSGNEMVNTDGYYASINTKELLEKVKNEVNPLFNLPRVILPLSNVYLYAGMAFQQASTQTDDNSVVAIQATYSPTPA